MIAVDQDKLGKSAAVSTNRLVFVGFQTLSLKIGKAGDRIAIWPCVQVRLHLCTHPNPLPH